MRYSSSIIAGAVAFTDGLAFFVVGLVIYLGYVGYSDTHFIAYLTLVSLVSVLVVILFSIAKLYRFDRVTSPLADFGLIITISIAVFLILVTTVFALKISALLSRVWMFSWFFFAPLVVCAGRWWILYLIHHTTTTGRLTRRTAVVGAGMLGEKIIDALQIHDHPWIRLIGVFDDRETRIPETVGDVPVLGDLDELVRYAREDRCDDIIIALPWIADSRIDDILWQLEVLPVRVLLAPDLAGLRFSGSRFLNYGGLPVLRLLHYPMYGWGSVAKSIIDCVFSVAALLILSPLMIAIAIAIKLDSPGPVIFRQMRYGFNNKPIEILKFRTLHVLQQDDDAEHLVTQGDSRVTRVGAILRRTSLDEFPQFISVLKGDMSVVGPRPHAFKASAGGKLYEDAVSRYSLRHKVKPGITGWAQVNGWRGETDTEEKIKKRVEHDVFYIEHWSVRFDIYIILKTILLFFTRQSAY